MPKSETAHAAAAQDPREMVRSALRKAVAEARCPGGVAYVGDLEHTHFHEACGNRQTYPAAAPAASDTIYDLASLTKVVATTTALLLLREDGVLELDQPVTEHLPIPAFKTIAIRHLLTHTAGLVAGKPYYTDAKTIDEMLQRYASLGLDWTPGTRWRYSDAGYMILGRVVELAAGDTLDAFCAKRIFKPLGMTETRFCPPAEWAPRCAPTERCPWRKQLVVGKVHDENAAAVGGVAGHAGVFSTAGDLALYCRALLGGKLLPPEVVEEMTRLGQVPSWPWQGLGWRLDPWSTRPTGFLPSRTAFGHTGWTGTSLWLDKATKLFAILLGNTCHPTRARRGNDAFRRTFHSGVAKAYYPDTVNTHSGLDRVVREQFSAFRGRRVALLTHHAAVDQLSRGILDVFKLDPAVRLHLVYSPEHGLHGTAEAGQAVDSKSDLVPLVSLYGDRTAPSQAELEEVDYLLVDLQDVGSRYYTYAATMKACMAACAKAGKPVVVLDRPNPVNGRVLEGPIAENTASHVCWGKVPVRHGMTMGEIALFFQKGEFRATKLKVMVKTLDNWDRGKAFGQCSLPWVPPSPNIPTPETALLYVGMCLFEGTNLNEGRGTDTPFLVIGAPWLRPKSIIAEVPPEACAGLRLTSVVYTPKSIPGKASSPRYQDQSCPGVRIALRDSAEARPFTLALALLSAIRQVHPKDFEWKPFFDTLAGSPDLRQRLDGGEGALSIVESYEPALRAFDARRPKRYE
jgi:uncharacterized protein YbbC (DUF1343 family)/CubicO group peptidase (beta-lactamase class C family)